MIAPEYRPFVTYLGRRTDRPTITVEEVCDGDRAGAQALLDSHGQIGTDLAADLARIEKAGIPVDIVLRQGRSELGL